MVLLGLIVRPLLKKQEKDFQLFGVGRETVFRIDPWTGGLMYEILPLMLKKHSFP